MNLLCRLSPLVAYTKKVKDKKNSSVSYQCINLIQQQVTTTHYCQPHFPQLSLNTKKNGASKIETSKKLKFNFNFKSTRKYKSVFKCQEC